MKSFCGQWKKLALIFVLSAFVGVVPAFPQEKTERKLEVILEYGKDPFLHYRQKSKKKKKTEAQKKKEKKEDKKLDILLVAVAISGDVKVALFSVDGRFFILREGQLMDFGKFSLKLLRVWSEGVELEVEGKKFSLTF